MSEMWGLLQTLVICCTAVYTVRTIADILRARQAVEQALQESPPRAEASPVREVPLAPRAEAPIPIDLLQLAEHESEGWARESAIKVLHELYDQTKDWNVVRTIYKPYPDSRDLS